MLYIFWILHQTTTRSRAKPPRRCCISFESYIKPQHDLFRSDEVYVVYLLNPTSNHNLVASVPGLWVLYIFWILHQTTTTPGNRPEFSCCISFESYIKPQHFYLLGLLYAVVYLLNPTSNHNYRIPSYSAWRVVYLLNPTSNHNYFRVCEDTWGVVYLLNPTSNHNVRVTHACKFSLYIFWILHQTTTIREGYWEDIRCISFESYIKPQLEFVFLYLLEVVYLLNPTSNHNFVGYNLLHHSVVYLLNPTSNHNSFTFSNSFSLLYIFWILHQTTTAMKAVRINSRCISFESYIKPQLIS